MLTSWTLVSVPNHAFELGGVASCVLVQCPGHCDRRGPQVRHRQLHRQTDTYQDQEGLIMYKTWSRGLRDGIVDDACPYML
jgi:hypothetical protein